MIKPGDLVATRKIKDTLVYFYVSDKPAKKYKAVVWFKNRHRTFHFGDTKYFHYKDAISSYWSHLNHNDKERRRLYRLRHAGEGLASRFPSAGWFSWNFLW